MIFFCAVPFPAIDPKEMPDQGTALPPATRRRHRVATIFTSPPLRHPRRARNWRFARETAPFLRRCPPRFASASTCRIHRIRPPTVTPHKINLHAVLMKLDFYHSRIHMPLADMSGAPATGAGREACAHRAKHFAESEHASHVLYQFSTGERSWPLPDCPRSGLTDGQDAGTSRDLTDMT
jgi:hypothetical protein